MDPTEPTTMAPSDQHQIFAQEVLKLFSRIHPLDRIPRAGFLLRGVTEPESVAAHSHFMALLALLCANHEPDAYDLGKILAMALIHDLAEARLMDIPMPAADAWLGDAKRRAEQGVLDEMFQSFPTIYSELHNEFIEGVSKEARLLKAVDKAQMMLKVLFYEQEHRGRLDEFWRNPSNFDPCGAAPIDALFDAICRQAGRPRPAIEP